MAKPYDATLKHLVDLFADDWGLFLCQQLRLPERCKAEPLDADLSTVGPQADKLFRLSEPPGGYIHLELEASWAGDLPDRILVYNVLTGARYGRPVRSVAVLLRKSAQAANVTGSLVLRDEAGDYLHFRYVLLKLWELPCEPFLAGPLGTLPLGLLTDDAQQRLPALLQQVDQRLRQETESAHVAGNVWTACNLLLGLRYDKEQIVRWFQGVRGMEESTTYQAIVEKGLEKGRRGALLSVLRELGEERFGAPQPLHDAALAAIADVERLDRLRKRLLKATDWDDLLRTP